VNRRLLAALIAGATAAAVGLVVAGPVPSSYLPVLICYEAIGLSFLGAGIAAWLRWPASRLGLLFTAVGYLYMVPYILTNMANPVAFTIGNASQGIYGAALAHLGLAWPTGRLRSTFERGVVIAEYITSIGLSLAWAMFWNPAFSGCAVGCPANVLLIGAGSRPEWNTIGTIRAAVGLMLTGIVVALIVQHWRSAHGWSRRAMVPLVWIAFAIGVEQILDGDLLGLPLSGLESFGLLPLVLLAGPALFVISTVRARTAGGALGTAIVDLEPGASPGRLRDVLARALGDSTLQLAFRQPDGAGYLDTAGQAIDADRPDPGRAAIPVAGPEETLLVYDAGLDLEPQLVRLAAAAAGMALEHARLQAEVQAQLEQVRASRARIVEAGDAERRRLERDLHDGAQQRLVTLALALAMARDRAADPELASLIESASKEAREALTELRELARGIHPAVLTETGLAGAIQALAERSPVPTAIVAVPDGRFPAAIEATAYFVVCEALANVAKHAMAGSAEVTIRTQPGRLVVQVSDDGAGGARPEKGSGLRGLADRVATAGGVLRVDSPPGSGTRLEADIPCP
jgi:signal transduction histidine kinase